MYKSIENVYTKKLTKNSNVFANINILTKQSKK